MIEKLFEINLNEWEDGNRKLLWYQYSKILIPTIISIKNFESKPAWQQDLTDFHILKL